MNRYPRWKYAIILVALFIGALYALPNLFGESPAVQVSAARSTVRIDTGTVTRVEQALAAQNIETSLIQLDASSVKARFNSTDDQIKARDALERAFNPDPADVSHVVALNLLPRTVFVLSRFDEVADMSDPAEFQERFLIKKASVLKRLDDVLNLTAQEHTDVSVVAVAANPFDMGVEHWLQNLAEFRRLSRIDELQAATQKKIEGNGGMLALVSETKKSIISDIITKQLPAAKEAYAMLADEARRVTEIKQSQTLELQRVYGNIGQAQVRLRGRLLRYFEDVQLQAKNVTLETFGDFIHREIGNEGCLVEQRIQLRLPAPTVDAANRGRPDEGGGEAEDGQHHDHFQQRKAVMAHLRGTYWTAAWSGR